jgi:hypothetical protein
MPIQKLKPTIINPPLSKLYKRYDEITESHCKNLLIYLYTDYITEWINPITKKEVKRDSPIIISFLSKCYWGEWGEKEVTINGIKKKYKIHVSYFIDEWYLYDVRFRPVPKRKSPPIPNLTPVATPNPGAASSRSNSPAGAPLPRSKSPPKIAINVPVHQGLPGAATNRPRVQSPPGAATNRPRVQSPPGAATNKLSSPKIDFSPRSSYAAANKSATFSINADKLNEDICSNLVKKIRDIIKGKTKEEIKLLKVPNPITKQMIGLKSPILLSYLTKCYFAYDKNEELQKSIKKIVNIKGLEIYNDIRVSIANKHEEERIAREKKQEEERLAREQEEEEKRLALEKRKEEMKKNIPIIDRYIEGLVDEFNVCCDELRNNCDKNGVLKSYLYISNVINSIIIIIYTKYLHLPYYYDELYLNNTSQLDLKVFMYDETFHKYYENRSLVPWDEFKKYFYDNKNIIYQKHDLTKEVTHTNINLEPKTIENYYLNTLINRQHVFEAFKYDPNGNGGRNYNTHLIQYNKLNTSYYIRKDFNNYKFPDSLKFAKEVIDELNINYNITNGLLPKTIFWWSVDNTIATNKPFSIDIINDKLRTLPTITGIANEATIKNDHYEAIIEDMKGISYGNNETEYGGDDMIRKNILYSLNAQTPTYIQQNMNQHKQDIYYNYEYTGTYPLFSWIPLNHQNIDSLTNQNYCYPMSTEWQPLEIDLAFLKLLELDYKNHGVAPYSTYLNETIYKVITDEYASVKSLIHANRIQAMRKRIINTIGVYKDKTRKLNYKNKKIYLYHGTKNRLHSIGGKEKEIEILGFLSTSLSVYIASYYSGLAINNVGLIYIIEVDDTQSYINLNDLLNQILILPLSRIKIIMEFNVGAIRIILCRLFRTPIPAHNNLLYNKLLDQNMIYANTYVTYRITTNNNIMPTCAYILGDLWKINKDMPYKENLEIYKVMRRNLNNKIINKRDMTNSEKKDEFLYFSLGQEYELYVDRGLPLISGSLEDIKYSIHQHFIKDCYKALGIPCIDYIFIHGANKAKNTITGTQFNKCPISTGILLKDYINNRTNVYKYNINNFLIDSIFKFNSIKHDNKKLNLQEIPGDINQYADKIEGFRDAGAYLNGSINPLFKKDEEVGEHIQYMRDWKHMFIKYKEASNEDLATHFDWCHKRITKLLEIITSVSENYLFFISKTLKGNTKTSQQLGRESVLSPNSKEYNELFNLIKNLEETLLKRAKFYLKCTHDGGRGGGKFIDFIKFLLSDDTQQNTHNSKLYTDAIQEDLILDDTDLFLGGIKSIKEMTKQGMVFKPDIDKAMETNNIHMKIYEEFKNIPISESKDMRKFEDMPEDIREYYNLTDKDEGKYIDISNNCHFRFVNKKDNDQFRLSSH